MTNAIKNKYPLDTLNTTDNIISEENQIEVLNELEGTLIDFNAANDSLNVLSKEEEEYNDIFEKNNNIQSQEKIKENNKKLNEEYTSKFNTVKLANVSKEAVFEIDLYKKTIDIVEKNSSFLNLQNKINNETISVEKNVRELIENTNNAIKDKTLLKNPGLQTQIQLLNVYNIELNKDKGALLNIDKFLGETNVDLNKTNETNMFVNNLRNMMFPKETKDEKGNIKASDINNIKSYNKNWEKIDDKINSLKDSNLSIDDKDEILNSIKEEFAIDRDRIIEKSSLVGSATKELSTTLEKNEININSMPALTKNLCNAEGKKRDINILEGLTDLSEESIKKRIKDVYDEHLTGLINQKNKGLEGIKNLYSQETQQRGKNFADLGVIDMIVPWKMGVSLTDAGLTTFQLGSVLFSIAKSHSEKTKLLKEINDIKDSISIKDDFVKEKNLNQKQKVDITNEIDILRKEHNEKNDNKIKNNEEFLAIKEEEIKKTLGLTDEDFIVLQGLGDDDSRIAMLVSNKNLFNNVKEKQKEVLLNIEENINEMSKSLDLINNSKGELDYPYTAYIKDFVKIAKENDVELNRHNVNLTNNLESMEKTRASIEAKIEANIKLDTVDSKFENEKLSKIVENSLTREKEIVSQISDVAIILEDQKNILAKTQTFLITRANDLGIYDPNKPLDLSKGINEIDFKQIEKITGTSLAKSIEETRSNIMFSEKDDYEQSKSYTNKALKEQDFLFSDSKTKVIRDNDNTEQNVKTIEENIVKVVGASSNFEKVGTDNNVENPVEIKMDNTLGDSDSTNTAGLGLLKDNLIKSESKSANMLRSVLTNLANKGVEVTPKGIIENVLLGGQVDFGSQIETFLNNFFNNREALEKGLKDVGLEPDFLINSDMHSTMIDAYKKSVKDINDALEKANVSDLGVITKEFPEFMAGVVKDEKFLELNAGSTGKLSILSALITNDTTNLLQMFGEEKNIPTLKDFVNKNTSGPDVTEEGAKRKAQKLQQELAKVVEIQTTLKDNNLDNGLEIDKKIKEKELEEKRLAAIKAKEKEKELEEEEKRKELEEKGQDENGLNR